MRLSWNELRARAAEFARSWADAAYEKGETQSFYNEFFAIFGLRRRDFAAYERHIERLDNSHGYIDLFWPKVLLVEQKSAGRSLAAARQQAFDYLGALPEAERPRHLLLCDFQNWELLDLDRGEEFRFHLSELPQHIERFGFVLGLETREFRDQDPVNIAASERIGAVYDGLRISGYQGDPLQRFLVRVVFCLFADNTGIFERDSFLNLLEQRTSVDGADTGMWLNRLFDVLNTPEQERSALLDEDLADFPYINGDLFTEQLQPPDFDSSLREALISAARFDWSRISPAIFGALFQSVMEPAERRARGAHYTTEQNIRKVIDPLFLDDLHAEFERIKGYRGDRRRRALQGFQRRLGELTLFDPACGCGNFLIIAYRELRLLEIDVLRAMHGETVQSALDLSVINVNQFYGVELLDFPARIAETALWMMDHIMNVRLSQAFGQYFARIPLRASPHIHCADALEIDWNDVLSTERCSYVFGNPPFIGAKFQSPEQRAQVRRVADLGGSGGSLDYVAAWLLRAGEYVQHGKARIGFVATNSITQGEQVGQLWPLLFERYGLEISYGHRTFAWGSDARGAAHVHVVVIGLCKAGDAPAERRLFSYGDVKSEPLVDSHTALSPYLIDASAMSNPQLVVSETNRPLNGLPRLKTGVQMIDDGILTFTQAEYDEFVRAEPGADRYFRKYIGGDEYINGFHRWILYLRDASPNDLRDLPLVRERIRQVRAYRDGSRRASTRTMHPTTVGVDERLSEPYLVLPNTSSERRDYVPIGWLTPDVIANQKLRILPNAERWHFALLTSTMHMAWMRAITGRMKSDYMYSVGVVYNTFPLPEADRDRLQALAPHADAVLEARDQFPEATLAELYDPDLMPPPLRQAHQQLDRAVDRLYRRGAFRSERERVEYLLALYERMIAPLDAAKPKRRRRPQRPASGRR